MAGDDEIKVGQRWQRRYEDRRIVTVVAVNDDMLKIKGIRTVSYDRRRFLLTHNLLDEGEPEVDWKAAYEGVVGDAARLEHVEKDLEHTRADLNRVWAALAERSQVAEGLANQVARFLEGPQEHKDLAELRNLAMAWQLVRSKAPDTVVLKRGDSVAVRWLDEQGYHHAQGVLEPTDEHPPSLRVRLRPAIRNNDRPDPEVTS